MYKKILFTLFIISSYIFVYTQTNNNHGKWFITEQTLLKKRQKHIAQEYWNTYVLTNNEQDHSLIKHILTTRLITSIDHLKLFETSLETHNFDIFTSLINNLDNFGLSILEHEKHLSSSFNYGNYYPCKENITINAADIKKLQEYIRDSSFSGIVSIRTPHSTYTASSSNINDYAMPFSIHSISKVFTEILFIIMIEENIIPQTALDLPLAISETAKTLLYPAIVERLEKVTVKQIMNHQGGFGDYTFNYFNTLMHNVQNNEPIKYIEKLEDFLPYADNIIFPNDNEYRYSNLGIVLLGLSIEHLYNKAYNNEKHLSFEEIVNKYIIQPAGMKIFSSQMPYNGCFNESGLCAQYICGSPAGSHWTTAEDLHNFARWLQKKCETDSFKKLFSTYFYDITTQEIHHCGGIGQHGVGEASARFALFLRQGISVVILSNKPQQAFTMYQTIYHNIFANQTHNK
jgi:CubicO group peptidase (beta-lactamase class C family)